MQVLLSTYVTPFTFSKSKHFQNVYLLIDVHMYFKRFFYYWSQFFKVLFDFNIEDYRPRRVNSSLYLHYYPILDQAMAFKDHQGTSQSSSKLRQICYGSISDRSLSLSIYVHRLSYSFHSYYYRFDIRFIFLALFHISNFSHIHRS